MGKSISRSYKEQEKAIKNGEISFDLNLYFIGDTVKVIYERFKSIKSQQKKDIFSNWNYYFHKGDYESQLKEISELFLAKQSIFINDPVKYTFKEAIIIGLDKKDDKKIEEIIEIFAGDKQDVYCPFIIFIFNEIDTEKEKIIPNEEDYYISPMKIFTFKFGAFESDSMKHFHTTLYRICSYYNELGEEFLYWPKDSEEPIAINLIDAEFNSYINIFCLGKTGSGKSTFLNKFFGSKKSKQGGTGKSTTSKIIKFGIDKVPIRIYDIPGFEGEETIEKVNNKLIQVANEMNSDKDRIHLILYFININEETYIYEMENIIIETLKTNNKDIRIIFIMTHSSIDPYSLQEEENKKTKKRRKSDILRDKLRKAVNIISSTFGEFYSFKSGYFQEDSLIQKNLIFVNLEKDYEHEIEPFGFDKVIRSIYNTLTEGNDIKQLAKIKEKLADAIINKIKNDEKLDKDIEECLSKGYLLYHSTFALQKEKSFKEAQKLYDGMFSLGMNVLTVSPFLRDIKLTALSYHKRQFKMKLSKIFGFNIKNKKFDIPDPTETEYEKMTREYMEKLEASKKKEGENAITDKIEKDINANEVNSTWILANEAAGYMSYICLFGGPVLLPIGIIGMAGTSYVSYKQFKKDCTEYLEQYKKNYEEFKYCSLYNFICSIILGIEYLETYIVCCEDKAAPCATDVIENIKKEIERDFKTANGKATDPIKDEKEIRENIPFLEK